LPIFGKSLHVDTCHFFSYRAGVETREKILETAVQLFAAQGYADTSLAQVARTARVSKALILWYFDSKERLFQATVQHFLRPYEIDDQGLRGLDESAQVEKFIDDYFDFIIEHLPSVKFVLGQVVRDDDNSKTLVARVSELYRLYRGLLTSIVERGQARRVFTLQGPPAEEAALIMATLNGLLLQRLIEPTASSQTPALLSHLKQLVRTRLHPPSAQADVAAPVLPGSSLSSS
jgi:AcrR family transcriptional regulator